MTTYAEAVVARLWRCDCCVSRVEDREMGKRLGMTGMGGVIDQLNIGFGEATPC